MTWQLLKSNTSGHSLPHTPPPRFSTIMKTVLPFLVLASFVVADNDNAGEFDLNSGVQTQQETEALEANKLTYTTGGGVPSVHSVLVNMAISNRLTGYRMLILFCGQDQRGPFYCKIFIWLVSVLTVRSL